MTAPLRAPVANSRRTMGHVEGSALVDFAAIYEESVELVSVARPRSSSTESAAQVLLASDGLQAQWIQGGTEAPGPVSTGRSSVLQGALDELRAALDEPVEVLRELLDCISCGVRVKVLDGPMCPRFHVDHVPARMLITVAGGGTEWIAHDDVDETLWAARDAAPLRPGGHIRSLATGSWSLLKGGRWDSDFCGVLHRSPSSDTRRLLVSLDPIFSD